MKVTVFYDGQCPLCVAEMDMLRSLDTQACLQLEDIHTADFSTRYPSVDRSAANRILHGIDRDGHRILGLDVTVAAWNAVGKKRWLSILRWPIIRWFADRVYLAFAQNRQGLSSLFMRLGLIGVNRCDMNSRACAISNTASNKNCVRNVDEDGEF